MDLAAQILDRREDVHFILVGDGPLKGDLVRKREALGLTGRLHMPGLKTDIRPYVASMDIYMMSSIFEGMPVALLEAMAMECAVVSTDAGGIKEVVRHEVDGLLCDVDDPQQMVSMVCSLIDDSVRRSSLAKEARKRIENEFGMEKMVSALSGSYERLVMDE
jgi:glycosyltransferase involved in cell wall biosynthesis